MVAPLIAAAGIAAAGQVAGGVAGGKAAKKVAKIQAQTAQQQMAAARQLQDEAIARYSGDIATGDRARDLYSGLVGTGGDAAASQAAYDTWKASAGYQNNLREAQSGASANAYAAGLGRSGAALKALQDRSADVANGYFQQYLSNVDRQVGYGSNAKAALSGISQNTLSSMNQSAQNSADASSNAALAAGQGWSNALTNLGRIGSSLASSYGGGGNSSASLVESARALANQNADAYFARIGGL